MSWHAFDSVIRREILANGDRPQTPPLNPSPKDGGGSKGGGGGSVPAGQRDPHPGGKK